MMLSSIVNNGIWHGARPQRENASQTSHCLILTAVLQGSLSEYKRGFYILKSWDYKISIANTIGLTQTPQFTPYGTKDYAVSPQTLKHTGTIHPSAPLQREGSKYSWSRSHLLLTTPLGLACDESPPSTFSTQAGEKGSALLRYWNRVHGLRRATPPLSRGC